VQADEVLQKIIAFKQYHLHQQELVNCAHYTATYCDVAYSSAQQQLIFRSVRHFFGMVIFMTFMCALKILLLSLWLYQSTLNMAQKVRIADSGGCWLRVALHTPSGARQKWWWTWHFCLCYMRMMTMLL